MKKNKKILLSFCSILLVSTTGGGIVLPTLLTKNNTTPTADKINLSTYNNFKLTNTLSINIAPRSDELLSYLKNSGVQSQTGGTSTLLTNINDLIISDINETAHSFLVSTTNNSETYVQNSSCTIIWTVVNLIPLTSVIIAAQITNDSSLIWATMPTTATFLRQVKTLNSSLNINACDVDLTTVIWDTTHQNASTYGAYKVTITAKPGGIYSGNKEVFFLLTRKAVSVDVSVTQINNDTSSYATLPDAATFLDNVKAKNANLVLSQVNVTMSSAVWDATHNNGTGANTNGAYKIVITAKQGSETYVGSVTVWYLLTRKNIATTGNLFGTDALKFRTDPINLEDAISQAFTNNEARVSLVELSEMVGTITKSYIRTNATSGTITFSIDGNNLLYGTKTFTYTVNTSPIVTTRTFTISAGTSETDPEHCTKFKVTNQPATGSAVVSDNQTWTQVLALITVADGITAEIALGTTAAPKAISIPNLKFSTGIYKITPVNCTIYGSTGDSGVYPFYSTATPQIDLLNKAIMHFYSGTLQATNTVTLIRLTGNSAFYNHGGQVKFNRNVSMSIGNGCAYTQDGTGAYTGADTTTGVYFANISNSGSVYIIGGTFAFKGGNFWANGALGKYYYGKDAVLNFGAGPGGPTGFIYDNDSLEFDQQQNNNKEFQLFTQTPIGKTFNGIGRYSSIIAPDLAAYRNDTTIINSSSSYFQPDPANPENIKTISPYRADGTTRLTIGTKPNITGASGTGANRQMTITWPTDNTNGKKYYWINSLTGIATCNRDTGAINVTKSGTFLLMCFIASNGTYAGRGSCFNVTLNL